MADDADSQLPKLDTEAQDHKGLLKIEKVLLPYDPPAIVEYANIFSDAFALGSGILGGPIVG